MAPVPPVFYANVKWQCISLQLRRRPKLAMLRSGSRRSLPSAFQTVGPTTANARRPYVSSCIRGRRIIISMRP